MNKQFNHGSTKEHQDLGKELLLAVSYKYSDIVMIPYTVGMFRDFQTAERIIHAGTKGVTDWIIFGKGFYLFLDIKTGNASFNLDQKAFKFRIAEINGGMDHVFKVKSVEEGLKIIENARKFYGIKG